MRFFMLIFVVSLMLLSCSENKSEKTAQIEVISDNSSNNKNQVSDEVTEQNESTSSIDSLLIVDVSILIPSFEIEVKLSKNAEEKMKTDKESVIVQAYFSGQPKDTTSEEYLKFGKIGIGDSRIELWDSRIAKFTNVKLSKKEFDKLSSPNFEVLINVFSGRHSSTNNLLSCDILQAKIDSIKGKKYLLNGKLIGEE